MDLLRRHKKKQNEQRLLLGISYVKEDLVCCNEDGSPIIPGSFSHMFTRLLRDLNLKRISFHDLRHTHASLLLKYGVAAKVAYTRLGHSSIGITLDLYSHIYSEVDAEASNKIEAGIFNQDVK